MSVWVILLIAVTIAIPAIMLLAALALLAMAIVAMNGKSKR